MSTKYTQIRYEIARFEGGNFSPAGQSGDWLDIELPFESQPFVGTPRVIITPVNDSRLVTTATGERFNVMKPVCVARDVTPQSFRLAARNADPDFGGNYAFNWIAIEEAWGEENAVPDLRTEVFPPMHFCPAFESFLGQRTFADGGFAPISLDNSVASVQLTATNQNVTEHNVAAVGVVHNPLILDPLEKPELSLKAHNLDILAGGCAFDGAAFSYNSLVRAGDAGSDLWIDTGVVEEKWFEPSGHPGDWQTWDVGFTAPFNELPIVLLTPYKPIDIPVRLSPAVLGMVQARTPRGCRIAARNSDIGRGLAGFFWIAICHVGSEPPTRPGGKFG
jgi:hypothetical protein